MGVRMPWCASSLDRSAVVGIIELGAVQVKGKQPLRGIGFSKARATRVAVAVDRTGVEAGRGAVPADGPGGQSLRSAGSARRCRRKEVRP